MRVKDVCDVNLHSLDRNTISDMYLYLDTSNIYKNKVDKYERYLTKSELPSRAKRLVKDKDILFSTIRPNQNHYGMIENPKENLLVSTGFAVLSAREEMVNPYYLYYWLTRSRTVKKLQMIAETAVSSYPSIRPSDIMALEIDLPSMDKQNVIAHRIRLMDDKTRENSNAIQKLEEYAQLLFHKWFVDYNFPSKSGKPYNQSNEKLAKVNGEYIPIGWEVKELNQLVQIKKDTVDPQAYPNQQFKHFSIPAYDETKNYVAEYGSDIKSNKYKVSNKNILVSKLNPWFQRVVYPMDISEAISSTEFVVWEPLEENHLEYLYVLANSSKFTRTLTKGSIGTSNSHKRVKPRFMLKYHIPYHKDTVSAFNELIKPVIQKIHLARKESQLISEKRDLLIKKLIK